MVPVREFDRLSPTLLAVAVLAVGSGVVSGWSLQQHRSAAVEHHSAATAAWGVHLVLTVVAAALAVAGHVRRRRTGRAGPPLLLAPVGAPAAARLGRTLHEAPGRGILAVVPMLLLLYCGWRVGVQVLAGTDPEFTADAWGGPGYVGAMYCHYLDAGLISAAASWALNHVLLATPAPESASP